VLVEYVFMIVIMAIFFSVFILLMGTVIGNTNRVVIGQELGVVANDVANRIVAFSGKISIDQHNNNYWACDVSDSREEINLPDMVDGKPYQVQVTFDDLTQSGAVTVTYGDDRSINSTAHFRSGVKVLPSTVNSTDNTPCIYYRQSDRSIRLVDN
jgi:hypothetical protein